MKLNDLFTTTERLMIRPPLEDDFEAWKEGNLQSQNRASIFDETSLSEENLTEEYFMEHIQLHEKSREEDRVFTFWAFEKETDKWVGGMSIYDVLRGSQQNAWFGGNVLSPYWGKGYATEGAKGVMSVAFQHLGLHRLEALTEPGNNKAQSVLEKLHFRQEGTSVKRMFSRDAWRDMDIFALVSEEYFAQL